MDELLTQPDVTAVPEEPVSTPEAPVVEEPSVGIPEPSYTQEPIQEQPAPTIAKDPLPAEVVRMLRELGKERPDVLPMTKALQDSYYSSKAYRDLFNIDDARSIKATMEAVGGLDGLNELQSRAEQLEQMDKMAESGDPKLMTSMASQSPEGFKKLVPVALEQLERFGTEVMPAFKQATVAEPALAD